MEHIRAKLTAVIFGATFALMAIVALTRPVRAECISVEDMKGVLHAAMGAGKGSLVEIGGDEMAAFLHGFNDISPPTMIEADYAVVASRDDRPKVAIALFSKGCFLTTVFLRKKEFDILKGSM